MPSSALQADIGENPALLPEEFKEIEKDSSKMVPDLVRSGHGSYFKLFQQCMRL